MLSYDTELETPDSFLILPDSCLIPPDSCFLRGIQVSEGRHRDAVTGVTVTAYGYGDHADHYCIQQQYCILPPTARRTVSHGAPVMVVPARCPGPVQVVQHP